MKLFISSFLVLSCLLLMTGCSIGYLTKSAYYGSKILINRTPIEEVVLSKDSRDIEKKKLPLVLEARAFAEKEGFGGGKIFSKYSRLSSDTLTYVVLASKETSFSLYTWWFPIVGTVPYKGFFNKDDAIALAKELKAQGYEASVRGASAFSTLGWFYDPVVTPMLNNSDFDLVTTILHELIHTKLWIKGDVQFNESMAQFLALNEAEKFFLKKGSLEFEIARNEKARQVDYALSVERLYNELDTVYRNDSLNNDQKLALKKSLFEKYAEEFATKYPSAKVFTNANNAELMQSKIYSTDYHKFQEIYEHVSGNAEKFLEEMRKEKKLNH